MKAGPGTETGSSGAESRSPVTLEVAAEAAVWVARLHGPSRSLRMEHECLDWQSRSSAHREAFERCTETWQDVEHVTVANAYASVGPSVDAAPAAGVFVRRWAPALALAAVVAGGALLVQQWRHDGVYSTGVGEQQLVLLGDGTRMTLNTDTRLGVELDASQRTVTLQVGEALFEVAKDAQRPFVVRAGGTSVVAHGTVFSVRLTPQPGSGGQALTVTLLEGLVSLQATAKEGPGALAPAQPQQLHPGERVRLARPADGVGRPVTTQVDRPNLESVTAWQRSEAVFDDVSLAEAVAEMNRYSRTPIVLLNPIVLDRLRVSGLYRTGDSAGFARAVAALHGLDLQERAGRLELAKPH